MVSEESVVVQGGVAVGAVLARRRVILRARGRVPVTPFVVGSGRSRLPFSLPARPPALAAARASPARLPAARSLRPLPALSLDFPPVPASLALLPG